MNIDYAQILERATARTHKLKQLQDLLSPANLEGVLDALETVHDFASAVHNLRASLDGEGRELIPAEVHTKLQYVGPRREVETVLGALRWLQERQQSEAAC